jgi:hypothetical protein
MTAVQNFRVSSFVIGLAIKAPCRAATTAPITLSGIQTINGYAGQAGDRILVKDQANSIENGIYTMESSAWQRDADFDGSRDVVGGTLVPAYDQTALGVKQWEVIGEPDKVTPDVDAITFQEFTVAGSGVIAAGENVVITGGGCLVVEAPDGLDEVTLCVNDTEQAYPFGAFSSSAAVECFRFDKPIWTTDEALHLSGVGTRTLAFYGYGDSVEGSLAQDSNSDITLTSLGDIRLFSTTMDYRHDGTRGYITVTGGTEGDLRLSVYNDASAEVRRITCQAGDTGGVIVTAGAGDNAVGRFSVQSSSAISSLEVKDASDTYRQVGLAVMTRLNVTGATTLGNNIWHKRLVSIAAADLTLDSGSMTSIPDDAVFWVTANVGAITLAGSGITVKKFLGGGAASTGTATIAEGGWATVVKQSSTEVWVQGLDVT